MGDGMSTPIHCAFAAMQWLCYTGIVYHITVVRSWEVDKRAIKVGESLDALLPQGVKVIRHGHLSNLNYSVQWHTNIHDLTHILCLMNPSYHELRSKTRLSDGRVVRNDDMVE